MANSKCRREFWLLKLSPLFAEVPGRYESDKIYSVGSSCCAHQVYPLDSSTRSCHRTIQDSEATPASSKSTIPGIPRWAEWTADTRPLDSVAPELAFGRPQSPALGAPHTYRAGRPADSHQPSLGNPTTTVQDPQSIASASDRRPGRTGVSDSWLPTTVTHKTRASRRKREKRPCPPLGADVPP